MLTQEGCAARLARLRQILQQQNLDAALISDRHEMYYFTGAMPQWTAHIQPVLLWVTQDEALAFLPDNTYPGPVVGEAVSYGWGIGSTANPDWYTNLTERAQDRLKGKRAARLGWQRQSANHYVMQTLSALLGADTFVELDEPIRVMQEVKDADEIALIRESIRCDLAAYDAAQALIAPGVKSYDVLAGAYAAAIHAAGEWVYHGGDFEPGPGGSTSTTLKEGDFMILDLQVRYRGYWSDLSRAFIIGGTLKPAQQELYDHIAYTHHEVAKLFKPGVNGTEIYAAADKLIRQLPQFKEGGLSHHAGHAIGIRAHELPDLNPTRGGVLRPGNIITLEPGAYHESLGGGVRLENMYLITETGAENLSEYPMSPIPVK